MSRWRDAMTSPIASADDTSIPVQQLASLQVRRGVPVNMHT
jgi:hypothetical protein